MEKAPRFLGERAPTESLAAVHRPALAPRRGEAIAWLCASGAALGTVALWLRAGRPAALGLGLTSFFLAAGLLISFGSWVDRGTTIRVGEQGLLYRSPLRRVELAWAAIDRLWAVAAGSGWRVGVQGAGGAFAFRTQGALTFTRMGEMAVGFPQGEQLAATIRQRAGLSAPVWSRGRWVCRSTKRS